MAFLFRRFRGRRLLVDLVAILVLSELGVL